MLNSRVSSTELKYDLLQGIKGVFQGLRLIAIEATNGPSLLRTKRLRKTVGGGDRDAHLGRVAALE
jgi:hypothetical protein